MKISTSLFIVVAISALLAACGGGGDSASSGPGPVATVPPAAPAVPAPTTPPVNEGNLQTVVPALTYSAASAEHAFVSELNQFRGQIGLGLLAQHSTLDKAAQNHLQYVLKNSTQYGGQVNMRTNDPATGRSQFHIENPALPLFTGVEEFDRARFAGYTGSYVGEELAFAGGKGGKVAFASLASTIYHRAGLMMEGLRDVGVAVGADASQTVVLELGYASRQANAADFVGVYPANNQQAVGLHTGVETPNPFPELSTSTDDFPTKTGYPVSVVVKESANLEVVAFTMRATGASESMPGRVLTRANDPNRYLGSNIAFLVAHSRLSPNTTYQVSFSGRANGVAIAKTWTFTTGS